ncbi:sodium:calcium exchanger [Arenibacter sp. N53]|nr:sodium:calcium exchanger [Arenibacter sp. N53]
MSLQKRIPILFMVFFCFTQMSGQQTYLDNFNTTSYSNNNGTNNFSSNWTESNDDNSVSGGNIRITGSQLRFRRLSDETIQRNLNLAGAGTVTLTFDYNGSSRGGETLLVQLWNGSSWQTVSTLNNDGTGSISYSLTVSQISASSSIRFITGSGDWDKDDYYYIDNVQFTATFGPIMTINDVSVNENAGTATFTVTHTGSSAAAFTVNYTTNNGTATAGSDYTAKTGTLSFTGTPGVTRTITINILDDIAVEDLEIFTVSFTGKSLSTVDITDIGTGTILDNDALIITNGATTNTCNAVFFDSGSVGGSYGNNENRVHTICPDIANNYISVDFTSFDVAVGDILYVYAGTTATGTPIGVYDNNNIPSSIDSPYGAGGCLTFRFTSNSSGTGTGWQAGVRCMVEGPKIVINDISFDETVGNAVFTVTQTRVRHGYTFLFSFIHVPFTVNFETVNGSALAGSDYTATSGTLTLNGQLGNVQTISVPIANDGIPENAEEFTIRFTGATAAYGTVNFSDTGTGTINTQILANDPLTLFQEFDGYYDYSSTGGTLRTQSNSGNACAITTSSSNTLISPIPATATVERAYLYWAHSNSVRDQNVTFEGQNVSANYLYQTTLTNRNFYGYVSDVTNIVKGIPNPSTNTYDFSDLNIDNTGNYCSTATVLGGWTLIVFYEDASLPAVNINLYQGFDGLSNAGTSFTLDSFYAIAGSGAKATFLSWEGDPNLDGSSSGSTNPERLSVTNQSGTTYILSGDGGQTGNNAYNSTIYDNTVLPIYNTSSSHGVDLDTYDISTYILPSDSQVTANVNVGQDFVISAAVVLKVPSNLIAGTVFEDMNYPGGPGRNRLVSGGIGVSGAVVELFNSSGTFIQRKNTDINGYYSFGGMSDGAYRIKAVNSSVKSNRGGLNCSTCYPVQTFRKYRGPSSLIEVTDEVGGNNPSAQQDVALGVINNAQSVSTVSVAGDGVVGIDFGFNFNTIVNTNDIGQGSLEQFIVNSNNLNEIALDIEANSIFDPAAGDDTSIFMIPPTSDPLGRTADANFIGGYFNIAISDVNTLSAITGSRTNIDGRTQTAYSGNTNIGTIGSGGATVGTNVVVLPNYDLPEIQIQRNAGDVFRLQGGSDLIRNVAVFANSNVGIRVESGSATLMANLLGVNAVGTASGNITTGVGINGGTAQIDGNYISRNTDAGILINGGTSTVIQNNHITDNGNAACSDNIKIQSGSGIIIRRNLIDRASSIGIDGQGFAGSITISDNTIRNSGLNGGNCSGRIENVGIKLNGNNSSISNNIINNNGGAGLVLSGGNTTGNLVSRNSFYANGTASPALGIDVDLTNAMGDGVTLNDNGDSDNGPNELINFPILFGAYASGSNLTIEGWSRPGATIELFLTDISQGSAMAGANKMGKTTDYGEGQTYLATFIEGSGSDTDSGTLPYTDLDGNTDNTNRFKFSIPMPPGVIIGNFITSTATIANSTSEFSPQSVIRTYSLITNRRITYRVNNN